MNNKPLNLLPMSRRFLLAAIAFGGSTAYALSFWLVHRDAGIAAAARWVGMAAGLSWVLFGLVLLGVTRGRPSIWAWADACLRAMAVGIGVKTLSIAANVALFGAERLTGVAAPRALPFHVAVLIGANLAMAAVFIARARRMGLGAPVAAALWFVVLNGLFALFFQWLREPGENGL